MSKPITIHERRAVEWREQEVSYTYEELLELFGDDDCSVVRPLVLRCMALEQERATFYEDYRRKFDVETKALHVEIERLRKERSDDVSVRREQVEIITSLERERDEWRASAAGYGTDAEQYKHERDEARAALKEEVLP